MAQLVGDADLIIGWRVNRRDPETRLRQSKIYNTLLKFFYGISIHDVNSIRLVKKQVIDSIDLSTRSAFVDAEMIIDAVRAGFRVAETTIAHKARTDEEGAGGGSLRTIIPTIIDMILYRLSS